MTEKLYSTPIEEHEGRTFSPEELNILPAEEIAVGRRSYKRGEPPQGFVNREDLGILVAERVKAQRVHAWPVPDGFAEPQRLCIAPNGDYILGACVGAAHQYGKSGKFNEIVLYRSDNKGATWSGPVRPWETSWSQHAFNPLVPRGSKRIYSFGTDFHPDHLVLPHNGAVSLRWSDDVGHNWSDPTFIKPANAPHWTGVGHMQPYETAAGTWLIGTYHIIGKGPGERGDRQHVLRSDDRGESWTLIPEDGQGWYLDPWDRMLEGIPIDLGHEIVFFTRTEEGHVWELRSTDDGLSWSAPAATSLVHPDAPPMIFPLADGKTLVAFTHNKPAASHHQDYHVRSELWVCTSADGGRTWTDPRFLLANAAQPDRKGVGAVEVSYADLLVDGEDLHLIFDHRKRQVTHVHLKASDLDAFPTVDELG